MFNFFGKTDAQIQKDVMTELSWDPRVTAEQVSATSHDGIVTLRGTVPHYGEKISAQAAAQRVGGVRAVADEIEVELLTMFERTDGDIAEAAVRALKWNYSVPKGIKVVVEKGWVTLSGEVKYAYQRTAARNAIQALMGVKGVSDMTSIKPSVQSPDVKSRILAALKRSAETEGREIGVSVDGSQVTLSGNLKSYAEIDEARAAAWNAPGVLSVENNLKLSA